MGRTENGCNGPTDEVGTRIQKCTNLDAFSVLLEVAKCLVMSKRKSPFLALVSLVRLGFED